MLICGWRAICLCCSTLVFLVFLHLRTEGERRGDDSGVRWQRRGVTSRCWRDAGCHLLDSDSTRTRELVIWCWYVFKFFRCTAGRCVNQSHVKIRLFVMKCDCRWQMKSVVSCLLCGSEDGFTFPNLKQPMMQPAVFPLPHVYTHFGILHQKMLVVAEHFEQTLFKRMNLRKRRTRRQGRRRRSKRRKRKKEKKKKKWKGKKNEKKAKKKEYKAKKKEKKAKKEKKEKDEEERGTRNRWRRRRRRRNTRRRRRRI